MSPKQPERTLTDTRRPGAVGRRRSSVPRGHGGRHAAHGTRHRAKEHSAGCTTGRIHNMNIAALTLRRQQEPLRVASDKTRALHLRPATLMPGMLVGISMPYLHFSASNSRSKHPVPAGTSWPSMMFSDTPFMGSLSAWEDASINTSTWEEEMQEKSARVNSC